MFGLGRKPVKPVKPVSYVVLVQVDWDEPEYVYQAHMTMIEASALALELRKRAMIARLEVAR